VVTTTTDREQPRRQDSFELAGRRIHPDSLRVVQGGRSERLEPKTMQVLLYLAQHAERVVTRQELEDEIWEGRIVTEDAVTNAIGKLRRVFEDDARRPELIETIPKTGYRLLQRPVWSDIAAPQPGPAARSARERHVTMNPATVGAAVLSLLIIGLLAWWIWPPATDRQASMSPDGERPTLAVMPFENLGGDPEQDYFANGITADLITDLSKLSGLGVIGPSSVFGYRNSELQDERIGAELGADYVVRGSVQRAGERLRINTRLVEISSDQTVWAERYDRPLADVFEIQDQVSAGIVQALEIELGTAERDSLARRPTASVEAYDEFLRGLDLYGRRTRGDNELAREHFERAIALDPGFARAHSGLALVYARRAIDGWSDTPTTDLARAGALARKAEAIEPSNPQVQFVLSQVALFGGRHVEAIEAVEKAIAQDPNYADAYALRAWILNYAGRPDAALPSLERAIELNPLSRASYFDTLGEIRYVQGRYAEAAEALERALQINPAHTRAHTWLAATYAQMNRSEDAAWEVQEILALNPEFSISRMRYAFPFKDPLELELLLQGLRRAGLSP
jgi:TolB-like protein/DNA-binding winged helix-turn-helix (wHTH) protein/Tfp pilus assembly protein PilF